MRPPLRFVFYIAATPDKVWQGFVSPEANRTIFMGSEVEGDWSAGSTYAYVGKAPDGSRITYVHGKVLRSDAPRVLEYTFAMGDKASRATVELVPETEATQVTVTHDDWADDDPGYQPCADGWPRILSRLKTLIETGRTFKPH